MFMIILTSYQSYSQNELVFPNTTQTDENVMLFKKPLNMLDSVMIDIIYSKICMNNFRVSQLTGITFTLLGTTTSGLSFLIPRDGKEDFSPYVVLGIGSMLSIVGIITFIDSYKWLKKASGHPIIEPYLNGVCIRF